MIPQLVTGYSIDTSKIQFTLLSIYKYGKLVIITGYGLLLTKSENVRCMFELPRSVADVHFFAPWASHDATGYGNFYILSSTLLYNNNCSVNTGFTLGLVYLTQ